MQDILSKNILIIRILPRKQRVEFAKCNSESYMMSSYFPRILATINFAGENMQMMISTSYVYDSIINKLYILLLHYVQTQTEITDT